MNEIVREFLLESYENLAQLDLDLVTLEKEPTERETLARTFRTLHTVKGTAGFLGLTKLQAVAHAGESLLSRLRAGERMFDAEIASALLSTVDAIRQILASLEATETEGDGDYSAQIETLDRLNRPNGLGTPINPVPMDSAVPRGAAGPSTVAWETDAGRTPPPVSVEVVQTRSSVEVPEETGEQRAAVTDSSIRVDVGLLDKLMNLVGELVLARNQILQYSSSQDGSDFAGTLQQLNVLTTELQAGVMKTRMQPIGNVWSKFPRLVRDMATACGKQVRIEMEGRETELDKSIIEAIRDPLTHLVRNGIDHGIEPPEYRAAHGKPPEGRIFLRAFHEGGKVIIEITDDGGGIDPLRLRHKAIESKLVTAEQAARMSDRELVNLVFLPGFSTTDRVTQFSGRGVGMDVVRTNIQQIGGTVDVDSQPGHGTTILLKIPLTLAIIPALMVTSGGDRYAIPQVNLQELTRVEGDPSQGGVEQIPGAVVYRLRGRLLPLVYLDAQLGVATQRSPGGLNIVVLQADDHQFGLVVDEIHDTEEIVVKPLQRRIKGIGTFAAATILGDGAVALILDVPGLARRAGVVSGVRERVLAECPSGSAQLSGDKQQLLLFTTSGGGRMAVPLSLVARLEEFPWSAVECAGAQQVVQYGEEILPLVDVDRVLRKTRAGTGRRSGRTSRPATAIASPSGTTVQVVVCCLGARRVGLVVGSILDIVEEEIESRSAASRPGVLFSAAVQGRVTEFLDGDWVASAVTRSYSA